jgi:FAD/FMN-containing dehydrogenase
MHPNLDVTALHNRVAGEVITWDHESYDEARQVFPGGFDRHPAAVVRVADGIDVARVIEFTQNMGLDISVRSGGHSPVAAGVVDNAVVVDVRGLNKIEIDPEERTAWVGSGVTAAEFTDAAGELGLAVGFGDTGSVGLGGIVTAGGVGFLARKHGLTIDSLLGAQVVTAAGEVVMVDEASHPDLFWAIRGGGGNFGVATKFRFSLQPIDRMVGGMLLLPATADVVAGFLAESEAAPEELTTIANVMSAPPMPFLPEEVVGQTVLMGLVTWVGDVEQGHEVMGRFRALAEPLADFVDEMPYAAIYQGEDEEYHPTAVALNGFTEDLGADKIEAAIAAIDASDAPLAAVQIRLLGGAVARVSDEATAYAHRSRKFMVNTASFIMGEEDRRQREDWVRDLHTTMTDGDDASYAGFLADEGPDRVRAAYPGGTWKRLREVKAKYDPENLFHHNQNVPPAV